MFFKTFKKSSKLEFQKEILINQINYNIEVKFSKKKNSSVALNNQTLIFRFPENLSNTQTKTHFSELLNKIQIKILKSPKTIKPNPSFNKILKNQSFQFSNQNYELHLSQTKGIKFLDKELTQIRINQNLTTSQIKKGIIKLLIAKYTPILKEHLLNLNAITYKYKITGFHTANLKSKWGHCTHDNKIMLNLKLLNTDIDILNYVIFHEISHIKQKNHSSKFWQEVETFCPNHKQLRKKLKNNPPPLFLETKP